MSWSVDTEGTHGEVEDELAQSRHHIPPSVRDATSALLAEFNHHNKVSVKTYGHHDGLGGGNATITVVTK